MALHLHRAARSDALVAALADVLRTPLADPMAAEVVAVPAQGIERWISQQLSTVLGASAPAAVDGVCANIDFTSPARQVARTLSLASGTDPDTDPWLPERLTWSVLAAVDELAGSPGFEALADHLGAGSSPRTPPADGGPPHLDERATAVRQGRRFAVAARIANLLDGYATHRPSLLQAWADGHATDGATAAGAATSGPDGVPLAAGRSWQPLLFRHVRAAVGVPSPAERLALVDERLRDDPAVSPLPARLAVFGATRLSARELLVLDALAEHRDVHLFLPHPSPALWRALAEGGLPGTLVRRRRDSTAAAPQHPLLRSLGRDSRELQTRLAAGRSPVVDHPLPGAGERDTLLGRLQHHLATDARPPGRPADGEADRRVPVPPGDPGLRVHACHGRERQIEVLRDVLVGLLEDDPTLEPRDVLVMCPDIELYAPLVMAAFGSSERTPDPAAHPGTRIRVRLADRALRRTNPVLDVLARVLELADSRMTTTELLDLAGLPPVRRRFGFDDDDLAQLHRWVVDAGVRWGLNEQSRARFGLDHIPQNTWRTGLDRVLLGVAMDQDPPFWLGRVLAVDDVGSTAVPLVGRFAEFVDRVALAAHQLSGRHPLRHWMSALSTAVDALTATTAGDSWQREQTHRLLAAPAGAGSRDADRELRLDDVRVLLAEALRGRPTRTSFRTGELTVCSMVPMRSVPHRVICLLGLDDGEFPRPGRTDGDDVLAVDPLVGERDRTSEDRQLLLDAVGAATEHLVVLYSGADHRTGAARPPAAALGEILDVLDDSFRTTDGSPVRELVHVAHPLQPFDDRNFLADPPLLPGSGGRAFSFDAVAARGAVARRAAAVHLADPVGPLVPTALPAAARSEVIDLEALIGFFDRPAGRFLTERLGLRSSWREDRAVDELTIEPDGLQQWQVAERLLHLQLAGVDETTAVQAELRRCTLPAGASATEVVRRAARTVAPLVAAGRPLVAGTRGSRDLDIRLADGRTVSGTAGPLRDGRLVTATWSKLQPRLRLRNWLWACALAADTRDPDAARSSAAVLLSRRAKTSGSVITTAAPDPEVALARIELAVGIRDLGLRLPLPLAPKLVEAYGRTRVEEGGSAEMAMAAAEAEWGKGAEDAQHRCWPALALRDVADLGGAMAPGVPRTEPTVFGDLAVALWGALTGDEAAS